MTEDVLVSIFDFLTKKEKWQLVMSNKTINKELRDHMYYEFNRSLSVAYFTHSHFRKRVTETIRYPNKQLSLFVDNINKELYIPQLEGLHTLTLCNFYRLKDVSGLERLHTLTLCNCVGLIDVSPLRKIHCLELSCCHAITDVSALGEVHHLTLGYCSKIYDVSALGSVHILTLRFCDQITDISALGRVHTLTLQHCRGITDVSALFAVHVLTIYRCMSVPASQIVALKEKNVNFIYKRF